MVLSCYMFCEDIFIIKKLFYKVVQTSPLLLKVWKCELDVDVTIFSPWWRRIVYQKVHIKTHRLRKEECFCNLYILINSNLFDKNRTQENVKNGNWTGKLQATPAFAYICWKKFCSHAFKASSEEVIVMRSLKMKSKYMKEDMWDSFFRKLAGWHLATSVQITLFADNTQGF